MMRARVDVIPTPYYVPYKTTYVLPRYWPLKVTYNPTIVE